MTDKPKCPNAPSPCFCTGECEGQPPEVEIVQYGKWETDYQFPVSDEDLGEHVPPGTAKWMERYLRKKVEAAAYELIDEALESGQAAATVNNDGTIEVHKLAETINQMAGGAESLRQQYTPRPPDDAEAAQRAVEEYRRKFPITASLSMAQIAGPSVSDLFDQQFGDPDDDSTA